MRTFSHGINGIFLFLFAADSDSTEQGTIQDILTCGSCQKTFALADIVKFIQHKVLQCNKENYGQCFPQGRSFDSIIHFNISTVDDSAVLVACLFMNAMDGGVD